MAAIIKIENLYKVYPVGKEKVVALGGISLEIEKGQICCILGTSGSGKSTLLNQLAGLEKPSKGRVLIGGVNISTLSEGQLAKFRQKNVGFIFQSYNLLQSYSALENGASPKASATGEPSRFSNRWDWADACGTSLRRCPVDSSSASALQGRLWQSRKLSLPTSRPATWTPGPPRRSWS